jgi:hypothetical protein
MKIVCSFLSMFLIVPWASGKEKTYTGSTPADSVTRSFLGIPLSDPVDFIRWKFILFENNWYELRCNYGIGKANTNGFVNGGTTVELRGETRKEKNYYQFQNGTKKLKAVELNEDLLHLLSADNSLLVGNGGWSYTLNNITPSNTSQVTIATEPTILKDSMAFEGRTPCNVPGVVAPGSLCYKLKWYIVLYANAQMNKPSRYKVLGTQWRKEGGRTGTWKIIAGQNGRTTYQLNDDKGNGFLYLLKLDEHILVFTDAQGKLLVGNEDFSYTLNGRW